MNRHFRLKLLSAKNTKLEEWRLEMCEEDLLYAIKLVAIKLFSRHKHNKAKSQRTLNFRLVVGD